MRPIALPSSGKRGRIRRKMGDIAQDCAPARYLGKTADRREATLGFRSSSNSGMIQNNLQPPVRAVF